ncbi:hypothetical protein [Cellulomonas sp. Leaf395]|uniref:hypothetical protein n=1 Tax=Cellulomonas sp. Leaf395 TaxID=1736362 RepID=UPI0006FAFB96|nr:hypothetical protein [Cellulomonas sp. Leaf395]KQS99338.1 hypothetical protein ASG23_07945 [Cellulomonas sp. Leaf395]
MDAEPKASISPTRLRAGVFLILLWWIPVWLAGPVIAQTAELDVENVVIGLAVVQTVLGALGALIVGKQIARILRGVPRKQMLPTVWRVFRHGSLDG